MTDPSPESIRAPDTVAVVVPCFRARPETLRRTLDSVLAQTAAPAEIVVVDDGSPEPFGGLDAHPDYAGRVHWLAAPENRGVAATRNLGVARTDSTLVAFLDTGDWWAPRKLEAQLARVAEHGSAWGLVYTGVVFHKGELVLERRALVDEHAYRELLVAQRLRGSASGVMMPRRVFDAVGGFETSEDLPEDRDLWLKVAREHVVLRVEEPLVHIEIVAGSRSSDPRVKRHTYRRLLERWESEMRREGLWDEARAHYHTVIAKKFRARREYGPMLVEIARACLASPRFVIRGIGRRFVWARPKTHREET